MKTLRVQILLLLFVLVFGISNTSAQNRNSIWCFGDSAGIDFRNVSNPVPISTGMDGRGSCASISDSLGNLLFYANTRAGIYGRSCLVWNQNHQVMLNGDSIFGESGFQELIIVPFPGNPNKYILFSASMTFFDGFYYSIIDMTGDSGLGEVVVKNVELRNDSLCDGMTAIQHGNGRDWWLITKKYSANGDSTFYEYLITPDTITERIINIGALSYTGAGCLFFNKMGDKLGFVSYVGLIETFDFDRCTGDFSNARIIHPQFLNNIPLKFGAEFSPNGNLLYITDGREYTNLLQIDLTAANVWNSRDTLTTFTTSRYSNGYLKRGPDDKIYVSSAWYYNTWNYPYQDSMYYTENMNLSVINNPDIQGSGCNFSKYSFYLGGKRTYWGLPNNPDYEMAPLWGSACDSLTNAIAEVDESSLVIFPNPASDKINITGNFSKQASCSIYNLEGRKLIEKKITGQDLTVDVSSLAEGIYLLAIDKRLFRKFSVIR